MTETAEQLIDYIIPGPEPERPDLNIIVGSNVKRLRTQQRYKKNTFCNLAGISRPYLDKIESGMADIRLSYLANLAEALGIAAFELLEEHGSDASADANGANNR